MNLFYLEKWVIFIMIEITSENKTRINNKWVLFVSKFNSIAHWKFKSDIPKELRKFSSLVISRFDKGYVILSEDKKYFIEWKDLDEKYHLIKDYLGEIKC